MPIFEYSCESCECEFEYLQRSASDPDPKCPTCCKETVKRLISASAVRPAGIPKGSGGFKAPACKPSGG
jgi:putative FmdB family regulatory protein